MTRDAAEALGLYLDAARRLQDDSAVREAREAVRAAELALEAAQARYREAEAAAGSALSDLRAAVEVARESGVRDPDPLGLLTEAEPEALVLQEEPDLDDLDSTGSLPGEEPEEPEEPEPAPVWRRSSPGVIYVRTYLALDAVPREIADLTMRAGGGGPGKGGAVSSALVHLADLGLAVRMKRPRTGKAAPRTLYRLADPKHLPLDKDDFLGLRALVRAGRTEEARRTLDALRAPAPSGDPDAPGAAAVTADVLPEVIVQTDRLGRTARVRPEAPVRWPVGAHVQAYDPEKHHYRPGVVEGWVTTGNRRGDYVIRLAGAARSFQAPPEKVKAPRNGGTPRS